MIEAANINALTKLFPAIALDKKLQNNLQCLAVQWVAILCHGVLPDGSGAGGGGVVDSKSVAGASYGVTLIIMPNNGWSR